jgi:A/G-specific adenine glycosylase
MTLPPSGDLAFFRTTLQAWAAEHPRPLPWKGIRDPYRIWLSEILLQQTRVEQGLPYYERFVAAYPTVQDLANAPDEAVFRLWEGLGYYARARNLLATARHIAHKQQGQWPQSFAGLRELKGVGDYTAAAIASFAYDLPYAVLDGNVFRVLSRWFGIREPVDTTIGKRLFAQYAQEVLDPSQPAAHNQAMMDFGATWCTPQNPRCGACPLADRCQAWQTGTVQDLPKKSKKMVKKDVFFLFLVIERDGKTWLRKRAERDIWQDLYEFPSVVLDHLPEREDLSIALTALGLPADLSLMEWSAPYKQTLTHREVKAVFATIDGEDMEAQYSDWVVVSLDQPLSVPVPRVIDAYWQSRMPK